jgi:hypothetical protein
VNADVLLMAKPRDWPRWPVLPLKRGDAFPYEVGYLYADGKPAVYLGNVTDAKHHNQQPTHEYDSFEAVYADGWRVD